MMMTASIDPVVGVVPIVQILLICTPPVQEVHVASDCYSPDRNLTLGCPSGSYIRVHQVSLGVSRDDTCPRPASWNVPDHCCTVNCDDCILADGGGVVRQRCEGRMRCDIATSWKRVPYDDVSQCAGKLTNYMVVAYSCTDTTVGLAPLVEPPTFIKDLVCQGQQPPITTPQPTRPTRVNVPEVIKPDVIVREVAKTTQTGRVNEPQIPPSIRTNQPAISLPPKPLPTIKLEPSNTATTKVKPAPKLPTSQIVTSPNATPQKVDVTSWKPTPPNTTLLNAKSTNITSPNATSPMMKTTSTTQRTTTSEVYNTTTPFDINTTHTTADIDNLGKLAKSEAMIYGSTAAAAVFILSIGVIVAWLFCRRRFDNRKQPLARKLSTVSIPIYAYNDPHMPVQPNYYHDYMHPAHSVAATEKYHHDMRMVQMYPPDYYMADRRLSELYPGVPGYYPRPPNCRRSESMMSQRSLANSIAARSVKSCPDTNYKKKTPTPARRKFSGESGNTEESDERIQHEFRRYVPVSEAVGDDVRSQYSQA